MPTTYTDQFFVIDPANPPPSGTSLTVQNYDFVDSDDNGFIQPDVGDTANGAEVTSVWIDDTITVTMGGSSVTITGVTFYLDGQPAIFTPTDSTVLEDATFQSATYVTDSTQVPVGELGPPCFTPGTVIETETGPRLIETLAPGDRVLTRDRGMQPVLWIGRRTMPGTGAFAPVRFAAGGVLRSPWGQGSWGTVPSPWRKDSVHVVLGGETYLLMFLSEKWSFVAVRCRDEQVSYGRLQRPDVPSKRLVF